MHCIRFVRPFFLPRSLAASLGFALVCVVFSGCVSHQTQNTPVQWNLSPQAQQTYATLLLDQSIRTDNLPGLLEAVDLLLTQTPVAEPIAEAAAWLMLNKEMEKARIVLEKAVPLLPHELSLRLLLAEIWLEDGLSEKAVRVVQEYRDTHPQSDAVVQELGLLLLKANRIEEAERQFVQLPERLRTPYIRYYHAKALMALKRPREAVRQLEQAIRELPDFVEAWSDLARAHEAAGEVQKARAMYDRILDQDPANQDVWLRLISLELNAKRPAKALELVRTGPESYGFQFAAATQFIDARQFREAEELLQQIKDEPDAPEEVYFYLAAVAYEQRHNTAEANELLLRISPGSRFHERAFRFRAQMLFADNKPEAALAVVREAQQVFPEEQDFGLMEVHVLMGQQLWQEALNTVDGLAKSGIDTPDLVFMRGSILDSMGRKKEALELVESLVSRYPNHVSALNFVGYTLAEAGTDLERAQTLLRRAVTLEPGKAYVLDSLAWAQYRAGRFQEAWKSIREAIQYPDSNDAVIWEHYGDIAHALGNTKEARRAWNKALTLEPENPATLRQRLENR